MPRMKGNRPMLQEMLNKIETEEKVKRLSKQYLAKRVKELVAMGIDKEIAKTLVTVGDEYVIHEITHTGG